MRNLLKTLTACAAILLSTPGVGMTDERALEHQKPGYMIVVSVGVNPEGMREYATVAVPLKVGGKLLFATEEGQTEVIEGPSFPVSIRVLEFPSLQAAKDFYYSAEYQAAIPLRAGNGNIQVMLADSWTPDPKWFRKNE